MPVTASPQFLFAILQRFFSNFLQRGDEEGVGAMNPVTLILSTYNEGMYNTVNT